MCDLFSFPVGAQFHFSSAADIFKDFFGTDDPFADFLKGFGDPFGKGWLIELNLWIKDALGPPILSSYREVSLRSSEVTNVLKPFSAHLEHLSIRKWPQMLLNSKSLDKLVLDNECG